MLISAEAPYNNYLAVPHALKRCGAKGVKSAAALLDTRYTTNRSSKEPDDGL